MHLRSVRSAARALGIGLALLLVCASNGWAGSAAEPKTSLPPTDPLILSQPPLQLQVKAKFEAAFSSLKRDVEARWGAAEVRAADKTTYVKYSADYTSRVIMDFRQGALTVEALDGPTVQRTLESTLVEALLTPDDPAAVELFSDAPVRLKEGERPYLYGLVLDAHGHPVETRAQAQRFARELVAKRLLTRRTAGQATVRFMLVPLVQNFEDLAAARYQSSVQKYAIEGQVSPTLVQAIAYTETRFNPFAISSIPTVGLMQLVPASWLWQLDKRRLDSIPTASLPAYLAEPEHSIAVGARLLGQHNNVDFGAVTTQESRDLCVIASYKAGTHQVLQAFGKDRNTALAAINGLDPPRVRERLRTIFRSAEERTYVDDVTRYRQRLVDTASH